MDFKDIKVKDLMDSATVDDTAENSLEHYGVLGMKWGRRKNVSDDYSEVRQIKKKRVSEMSNAELKKLNARDELENKYRQNNKGRMAKTIAIVGGVAAALGAMNNLYTQSSNAIANGKKLVKAMDNSKTLAELTGPGTKIGDTLSGSKIVETILKAQRKLK